MLFRLSQIQRYQRVKQVATRRSQSDLTQLDIQSAKRRGKGNSGMLEKSTDLYLEMKEDHIGLLPLRRKSLDYTDLDSRKKPKRQKEKRQAVS